MNESEEQIYLLTQKRVGLLEKLDEANDNFESQKEDFNRKNKEIVNKKPKEYILKKN